MKLTDEQEKQIIKAAIASTMTEEQKALGAFLGAMYDNKLDGKKMREAMLGILGITGDGRGEAATIAGLEYATGHLSALVDDLRALMARAMANMKALHDASKPADESRGDFDAVIPYAAFARFVDEHAALLFDLHNGPHELPATPPQQEQAAPGAVPDGWLPIETVPKDGREILVMCAGDDAAYVASWGEYPGNPVLDAAGDDSWMHGWIFKNPYLHAGGHEEGFLGWDDDPMPTHWMAAPKAQETGG